MSDELNNSLTSVAKGASLVFAGMIAGNFLSMINQIILGRFLGSAIYGLFNLALSIVTIASTLAVFGLFGSLSRFIPFNLKRGETGKVINTGEFSSMFVLSNGTMFAIALFVLSGNIAIGIFHEPKLEMPLKIFAIGIPVLGLQQVMRGITRGFKAVEYDAFIFNIGAGIAKIVFFLISLTFVYRLYGAIAAYTTTALATILVTIWLIRRRIFPDYCKFKRTPVAKELLSFSWPLALSGFTFLFVSKTDKVLLGYFLTSVDVGIYTPALVIASMLVFVAAAFKYIFLPTVSEYFSRKDIGSLGVLFKSTSKWIFLIILPLFILILLFPREVITLLYGPEYKEGYAALIVLSFGIAMDNFAGTAGNILVGGGRTKLNLLCEVIAAVTNIVLNIILIPRYGIVGAAVATGISYMTRSISSLNFVYTTYGIHPYNSSYMGIVFSGLIAAGIVLVLKLFFPFSWWMNMLLLGTVFVLLYLTLAVLTKSFDHNDRVVLEAVERKSGINLGFIKKLI
jgi:O-antigen/teichoic acid export membrane protein